MSCANWLGIGNLKVSVRVDIDKFGIDSSRDRVGVLALIIK